MAAELTEKQNQVISRGTKTEIFILDIKLMLQCLAVLFRRKSVLLLLIGNRKVLLILRPSMVV